MANVVGGVVVFTVSAVVPLLLAKAALSLVMSLLAVPHSPDPGTPSGQSAGSSSE